MLFSYGIFTAFFNSTWADYEAFEGNYVFTDISLGPKYCSLLSCYLFIQQQLRDMKFSKYNYKHNCTLNL